MFPLDSMPEVSLFKFLFINWKHWLETLDSQEKSKATVNTLKGEKHLSVEATVVPVLSPEKIRGRITAENL